MAEEKKKKLKTISIKGREYVQVNERIRAFNEEYPNGMIETKLLSALEAKHVFVEATIWPDIDKPARKFNARSQGVDGEGTVNKTACLENVETSAIGRALGLMGIGILDSVASADEMVKAGVTNKKQYVLNGSDDVRPIEKKCPFCGAMHLGQYPKCMSCYQKEKETGVKLQKLPVDPEPIPPIESSPW